MKVFKVELTKKVWINACPYECITGQYIHEIMNDIKEGDTFISNNGEVLICTATYDLNKIAAEAGVSLDYKALSVALSPTKKDGTIHKGRSPVYYKTTEDGWEKEINSFTVF
tara:strand:- start:1276 stop:1611 length:336 start_codon:yes stop_codon:yes gene_type:complete